MCLVDDGSKYLEKKRQIIKLMIYYCSTVLYFMVSDKGLAMQLGGF
jgi:hypothetical protein